jgi:hypothetical protein
MRANEAALCYEVPVALWENGLSLADWVRMIKQSLINGQH